MDERSKRSVQAIPVIGARNNEEESWIDLTRGSLSSQVILSQPNITAPQTTGTGKWFKTMDINVRICTGTDIVPPDLIRTNFVPLLLDRYSYFVRNENSRMGGMETEQVVHFCTRLVYLCTRRLKIEPISISDSIN